MIARRIELNPVFKLAQPLPKLSREPVAVRNCAAPCLIRMPSLPTDRVRLLSELSSPNFTRWTSPPLLDTSASVSRRAA